MHSARSAALSLLTHTEWPPKSNDAAQELLQTINNLPDLHPGIPERPIRVTAVELVNVLQARLADLRRASEKYGRRGRGLRDGIKYNLSSLRPGKCTDALRTCRDDIEEASTNLRNCLKNPSSNGDLASLQDPSPGLAENREDRSVPRDEAIITARKTFQMFEAVSGAIPVVGSFVGVAAKVGLAFVQMIETMDKNEEVVKELSLHTSKLSSCLEHFQKKVDAGEEDQLARYTKDLHRELERVQKKVHRWNTSGHFKKAFLSSDHAEDLKTYQDTLLVSLKTADLVVELSGFFDLSNNLGRFNNVPNPDNIELRAERTRLLDRLGDGSYGAMGSAIEDVVCLPGTRVEILNRINEWIKDTSPSAERVLWIRGMAGRGKSTIACTIGRNWASKGSCAIFHFRRGQNALDGQFICALARQLGKGLVLEVRNAILDCVRENEDIAKERLEQQFRTLLVGSLGQVQDCPHPIVIIVDALDECKSAPDAVRFVRLIDQYSSYLPPNVRFLLTCRPEAPLLAALGQRKWRAEDLDSMSHVSEDITRFIRHSLMRIRDDHGLLMTWPLSAEIDGIVEMSQGLFQWARTAVAYISDGSPPPRLRELLQHPSRWGGLDDLYHQILTRAFEKVEMNSMRKEMLTRVLGTLVVAPYPVTLEIIAFLHADYEIFAGQDDVIQLLRDIVANLSSLLHIPISPSEPIRLMHTSIRDLLTAQERCINRRYFVNSIYDHFRLASVCLEIMGRDLKQNICNLPSTPNANSEVQASVDIHVAKGLRYCCRSWSTHLIAGVEWSDAPLDARSNVLAKFKLICGKKILSWLEVMSLIGAMTEAHTMAKQIHRWLQECPGDLSNDSITILWNDTHRFITAFFGRISRNALDIYASALPRCPVETNLWLNYGFQATAWILVGERERNWSATIWTADAGSSVNTVAYSPDGSFLVSGSDDGKLRFWDAQTGALLSGPLTGHSSWVMSVAFSPDGKVLASGSKDKTVRLWNVQTGAPLGGLLTGHSDSIKSVVFSPDGKALASGSNDMTVRLWDAQTGAPLGNPLSGHSDYISSVVFSPDGKVLASGSDDKTIRLWDAHGRASLSDPLGGHSSWIWSVAFSPDGKLLASGSHDDTVRLWDAQTGVPLGYPLTGHSNSIRSIVFSPDGKLLASGSDDMTVRLWDAQTGAPLGDPLTGHSDRIRSVACSPDGKVLASGSHDGTVRVWDLLTGAPLGLPMTGHSNGIRTVVFSPDGKLLASGSIDHTVRLWDVQSWAPLSGPLSGHNDWIWSVVFSPDGKVLASGSEDRTIQLWDVQTGALLGDSLIGHSNRIRSVVFSPDGKLLASGSDDKTVRLWDPQARTTLGEPLTGHRDGIRSVVFSPSGKVLASGSQDKTVRLWDVQTGAQLGDPLTSHRSWVMSVAFSPDGKVLASGSRDGTVQLSDTQTGAPLGEPLTGHNDWIRSIVFSPDGKLLASGSDDETVRLWDSQTGTPLGDPLTSPGGSIVSTLFSPDGKVLASASSTGKVRFWDPLTYQMCHPLPTM